MHHCIVPCTFREILQYNCLLFHVPVAQAWLTGLTTNHRVDWGNSQREILGGKATRRIRSYSNRC